jgi:hypothetical protein
MTVVDLSALIIFSSLGLQGGRRRPRVIAAGARTVANGAVGMQAWNWLPVESNATG